MPPTRRRSAAILWSLAGSLILTAVVVGDVKVYQATGLVFIDYGESSLALAVSLACFAAAVAGLRGWYPTWSLLLALLVVCFAATSTVVTAMTDVEITMGLCFADCD